MQQQVAAHLAEGASAAELLSRVLATVGSTLDCSGGAVWQPAGDHLRCTAVWTRSGEEDAVSPPARKRHLTRGDGPAAEVWDSRRGPLDGGPAGCAGRRRLPAAGRRHGRGRHGAAGRARARARGRRARGPRHHRSAGRPVPRPRPRPRQPRRRRGALPDAGRADADDRLRRRVDSRGAVHLRQPPGARGARLPARGLPGRPGALVRDRPPRGSRARHRRGAADVRHRGRLRLRVPDGRAGRARRLAARARRDHPRRGRPPPLQPGRAGRRHRAQGRRARGAGRARPRPALPRRGGRHDRGRRRRRARWGS